MQVFLHLFNIPPSFNSSCPPDSETAVVAPHLRLTLKSSSFQTCFYHIEYMYSNSCFFSTLSSLDNIQLSWQTNLANEFIYNSSREIWKYFNMIFKSQIQLKEVHKIDNPRNLENPGAHVLWIINNFRTFFTFCQIFNHYLSSRYFSLWGLMMFTIFFSLREFDLSHNRFFFFSWFSKIHRIWISSLIGHSHVCNSLLFSFDNLLYLLGLPNCYSL